MYCTCLLQPRAPFSTLGTLGTQGNSEVSHPPLSACPCRQGLTNGVRSWAWRTPLADAPWQSFVKPSSTRRNWPHTLAASSPAPAAIFCSLTLQLPALQREVGTPRMGEGRALQTKWETSSWVGLSPDQADAGEESKHTLAPFHARISRLPAGFLLSRPTTRSR